MKKIIPTFLIVLTIVLTSFTYVHRQASGTQATRYAYVTDTEWDKSLDEPGKNGYVNITSNIVSVACNLNKDDIKFQ